MTGKNSRPFKAVLVSRFGVRNVQMPGHRIDGHVEQSRADMSEGGGLGQCIGVDGKDIQVRKGKTHGIVPDAMQLIFPSAHWPC